MIVAHFCVPSFVARTHKVSDRGYKSLLEEKLSLKNLSV